MTLLSQGSYVILTDHKQAGKTTMLAALARRLTDAHVTAADPRFRQKHMYPLRVMLGNQDPFSQACNVPDIRSTAVACWALL